ncbi:hypothetical protein DM860_003944 [Cuscuta australis]|uniref:Uncharacterized protein n=1 Tax=Cuscuta australis TaxID=267555 RepID=A0A328CUY7_9ASTE|nr:hypothetical protein DM860_003944 [Cuscuta australis]
MIYTLSIVVKQLNLKQNSKDGTALQSFNSGNSSLNRKVGSLVLSFTSKHKYNRKQKMKDYISI